MDWNDIYLLADIAELLPLGTVQVGEHVQEAAGVQHLAVVAVVGGQDAAVDLTVQWLLSYKVPATVHQPLHSGPRSSPR